jgi:hypothetical protein
MPSYCDTYPTVAPSQGPVVITLARGTSERPFDFARTAAGARAEDVEALDDSMETEEDELVVELRRMRQEDDVMAVDLPWELWDAGDDGRSCGSLIVLDTNIIIKHLALVQSLTSLLADCPLPHTPSLLIPRIVLQELDGLKNSDRCVESRPTHSSQHGAGRSESLGYLARAGTNWLLSVLPAPGGKDNGRVVRGQRLADTLLVRDQPRGENDTYVLDCCLFFRKERRVVLVSDDKNLCLRARFEQVASLSPSAEKVSTPTRLLDLLDPAFAQDLKSTLKPVPSSYTPPTPPSHTRKRTPLRSSRSSHDPRPRPSSPPPTPSRAPPPSKSQPPQQLLHESMDLDHFPTLPDEPPSLHTPLSPSTIFINLQLVLSHFLARPLYLRLDSRLPADDQRWFVELGDWRGWTASTCVQVMRKGWIDGDVIGLCERGIDRLNSRDKKKRLASLKLALPGLEASLATLDVGVECWNAPRWEVLLDGVQELLSIVLEGGLENGSVQKEVGIVVQGWIQQLAVVGIPVSLAI